MTTEPEPSVRALIVQEQAIADARAEGIGIGRLSGDVLAAELRQRLSDERYGRWHHAKPDGKCADDCPACERRGLQERIKFTEDYETIREKLASLADLEAELRRFTDSWFGDKPTREQVLKWADKIRNLARVDGSK